LTYLTELQKAERNGLDFEPYKDYEEAMDTLLDARYEAGKACGSKEIMAKLEHCLGIDSRGLEAGDRRPFLGVNMETVKAVFHYLDKDTEYQEISAIN